MKFSACQTFVGEELRGYRGNTQKWNDSENFSKVISRFRTFLRKKKNSENLCISLKTSEKILEIVLLCAVPFYLSAKHACSDGVYCTLLALIVRRRSPGVVVLQAARYVVMEGLSP